MKKQEALALFPSVFHNWLLAQTTRPSNSSLSLQEDREFRRFLKSIHTSPYRKEIIPLIVHELDLIRQKRPRKSQTLFHNLFPHDRIIRSLYRKGTESVYFDLLYGLLISFCNQDKSCKKTFKNN